MKEYINQEELMAEAIVEGTSMYIVEEVEVKFPG